LAFYVIYLVQYFHYFCKFSSHINSIFSKNIGYSCGNTSPSRVTVFLVWNVEMSFQVPVPSCESEIDDIDLIVMVIKTHQEIGGFDITVNKMTRVDVLNT